MERDQQQLRQTLADQADSLTSGQDRTNELVASEHERTRKTILASMRSTWVVPSLQRAPISQRDDLPGQEEKHHLITTLLLASLRFPTMHDRYDEVELAHRKTYDWIFQPPSQKHVTWSNFPKWLAEGEGIYWVNGKAASGKSTLMKFICNDPRTTTLLDDWSRSKKLIVAAHFFWNSGTVDQRSQVGLLRTLIYGILSRNKHLIQLIFPRQWAEYQDLPPHIITGLSLESWTLPRLTQAFELLFQRTEGTKFCIFIDGLDEFDGEPNNIIDLFIGLSTILNVKICLSSRPLYDFVDAFRSFPTLRLQDLTFNDIKQYVDDELAANNHMKELQKREPTEGPKLVVEIVDKADGVFLWVKLVVLSLLRGLRYSDQISDLQKRLELLPPSLEALFSHILGRLDPVYMQQSSRIFQIFAASLLMQHPLTCLELSFAEERDIEKLMISQTINMTNQELKLRCDMVNIWLLTRCGGLIEFRNRSGRKLGQVLSYLHRTVRDFLELPQIWSRVLKPSIGTGFNPHRSLLHAVVLYMKLVLSPGHVPESNYTNTLNFAMLGIKLAYHAERDTEKADAVALEEIDILMQRSAAPNWATTRSSDAPKNEQGADPHNVLLLVAIRAGLHCYVAKKLETKPDLVTRANGRPLLQYATYKSTGLISPLHLSSTMVQLLLSHGAAPNRVYNGMSAWQLLLENPYISQASTEASNRDLEEHLKIVRLFLENGADPRQRFSNQNLTVKDNISALFQKRFPHKEKELQSLLIRLIRTAAE
jgi:hypothetical protein